MTERPKITLVVDGVEVTAEDGEMLVDAAKGGDVEIPVFCYEPKLGGPVGACRMCLVEIEGIPKLQTGCSTPVRDGMVVYTRTDRVIEAQRAVVEFLLVNHPLDCPVCDKGGECPLQDIALGWGPGRSRVTEPKRHFRKPMPLSPLVRIDRERCILCYRCVRFSQDVAEDEQLQLLERGASTYVGTFDDHPYIAPFHGNIIELCPVGALTSEAYRFRARPWEIEDSGSICTLCPSQCNVKFTVRDERVERVLARDNEDVDAGWLCDKGRFGFQMIAAEDRIVEPRVGGSRAGWDAALDATAERLRAAGPRAAAIVGGQTSNEEGYLVQRIVRALGSPSVTTIDELDAALARDLAAPELAASVGDLDTAESILVLGTDPLNSMPILDLRIRRAVRHGRTRLVVASERPTALDGGAEETARYAPGEAAALLTALAAELGDGSPEGEHAADAERIAGELRPGKTVIVYGERLGRGAGGDTALAALRRCAARAPRRRRRRRPDRGPGGRQRPWPARGRLPARRRPRVRRDGGRPRARADQGGAARGRARRRGPAARGPDPLPGRRPGLGGGAAPGAHRDRGLGLRRRLDQGGGHRAPGRGIRREGGHGHASRRPRSAVAPGGPARGRRPPGLAGARRALGAAGRRDRHRLGSRGARGDRRRGPVLRRHHARGDRRHRGPLAGARRGRGVPQATRGTARAERAAG